MRTRKFAVGFFVTLIFLGAVNLFTYFRMPEYSTIDDGFVGFGWPFWLYASGGFAHYSFIIWTGVIGDVVIALGAVASTFAPPNNTLDRSGGSVFRIKPGAARLKEITPPGQL